MQLPPIEPSLKVTPIPQMLICTLKSELVPGVLITNYTDSYKDSPCSILLLGKWQHKFSVMEDEECFVCLALWMYETHLEFKKFGLMFSEGGEILDGFGTSVHVIFPDEHPLGGYYNDD